MWCTYQAGDVEAYSAAVEKSVDWKFGFRIGNADYNLECEWYVCTAFKMIDDKHVIGELQKNVLKNEVHHFPDLVEPCL